MKEKTLFRLALICIVIGLPVLYFLSENIEITEMDVSKISLGDADRQIKLNGEVISVSNKNKFSVIEISQLNKIEVVMFNENISLEQGDNIDVFGKVQEFNGKPEIIADVVRKKIKQ